MSTRTEERRETANTGGWLRLASRLITLAIVVVVVGAGVMAWRVLSQPFGGIAGLAGIEDVADIVDVGEARPNDEYSLAVEGGVTPGGHMTVVNNTNIALRLHVFNADDGSKAVARENIVIGAGEQAPIDKVPSVINIWKSQLFDAQITWTRTLYDDTIVINGDENQISIDAGSANTTFTNEVDEHVKVCTYQVWDSLQVIPLQCWTLAPNLPEPTVWTDPPGEFTVKVFHPQLVDDLLTVRENVPAGATITVRKG